MLDWLTRRGQMTGGLYFGPAAWAPGSIESGGQSFVPLDSPQEIPADRAAFLAFLEKIGLHRTSAITPSLFDQAQDLGDRRVRALVVNLLPTQPEFALPSALTRAALDEMIQGVIGIQKAVGAKKILIVTDRHDWRTRRLWRRAMRNHRAIRYAFVKLLNRYPQAHPTLLLWSLFGKRTAVGKLPTRANRVIVDPVACWALGRYVLTGQPFDQRPVQFFAPICQEMPVPRLAMGIIGETVVAFCARLGVPPSPPPHSHRMSPTNDMQVIVNGMMAGEEVDPAVARIDGSTESVSVRPRPAVEQSTPCFSCGWCLDVCPTRLNPVNLLDLAERAQQGIETAAVNAELRSLDARESLHCIGCGLCTYVCPTRLPLTQQTLRLRTWVQTATIPAPPPTE